MKTYRFILAAAALVSLASCAKDEFYNKVEEETYITITASFENTDTKTYIDGNNRPRWQAGDRIAVTDGTVAMYTVTLATSGTATGETGIIDESDNTKFTFNIPSSWENVYAVYPASCATGEFNTTENTIGIRIPRIQDGTFASANICVAKSTVEEGIQTVLGFRNSTAVLKVNPGSVVNDYMIFNAGSNAIAGNFTVTMDGKNIASVAASGTTTYSEIKGDFPNNATSYYAIAPVEITSENDLTLKLRCSTTEEHNGQFADKTYKRSTSLVLNKLYTFTPNFVSDNYDETIPIGEFSVSASKKVLFATGNLVALTDGNNTVTKFFFEANQYDYRNHYGCDVKSRASFINGTYSTSTPDKTVGTFRWAADANTSVTLGSSSLSGKTGDIFFTNKEATTAISTLEINGQTGVWRTLSNAEWSYLLFTRKVKNATGEGYTFRKTLLTISNGQTVYGFIIAPDDYSGSSFTANTSWEKWKSMESAGCVFLPYAGFTNNKKVSETESDYGGRYNASTPSGTADNYFVFTKWSNSADVRTNDRGYGRSVRMVRE